MGALGCLFAVVLMHGCTAVDTIVRACGMNVRAWLVINADNNCNALQDSGDARECT